MFSVGLAACLLAGAQLHFPQCFVAELEKFLGFARRVPSRSFADGLPQLLPSFFLHSVLALGPHVPLRDELHVNIVRQLPLLLGVDTDAVLHAHAIDALCETGVESGGEFLYLFEEFVLLGEDLVDVISDGVERLVVLETVLLVV